MIRGRVVPFALPFTAPVTLGGVLHTERRGWLLHIADSDGNEAWGEASPLPGFSAESLDESGAALKAWVDSGCAGSAGFEEAPSARFAAEMALAGLAAQRQGTSMAQILAGDAAPRPHQTLNAVLFSGEAVGSARKAIDRGYTSVKMKVGTGPVRADIERVRDVAAMLDGRARLRLDANRAWSLAQALEFARGIQGVELDYVEEPLTDPSQLEEVPLPLALDESLMVPGGHGDLLQPGELPSWAVAVILKPTLLGGFNRSRMWADAALARGIRPVVSSCIESGLGLHALLAFAAGLGSEDVPAGLETGRLFALDMARPPFQAAPIMDAGGPAPHPEIPQAGSQSGPGQP